MMQIDEALREEIVDALYRHDEDELAEKLERPLVSELSGFTNLEEEWEVERIRDKQEDGEPLTDKEYEILAYSQHGDGRPLSSGACLDTQRRRLLQAQH